MGRSGAQKSWRADTHYHLREIRGIRFDLRRDSRLNPLQPCARLGVYKMQAMDAASKRWDELSASLLKRAGKER